MTFVLTWTWRAHSRSNPASCCWTNRSMHWTRKCLWSCAAGSANYMMKSTLPVFSSRMKRRSFIDFLAT